MKRAVLSHIPAISIMILAIILSFSTYQDYGLTWDEDWQREIGYEYYTYINGDNPDFHTYLERDHGSGFELPLIYIEKGFNLTDSRDIYLMRHLVTHFFFLLSMFCGYIMGFRIFKNRWLASIVLIALIFHPRLYAHSYFNSKDIPAMCTFLLSMATGLWAIEKKRLFPFILFGIVCGYSTSIRLMNVIVIGPILLFVLVDILQLLKAKQSIRNMVLAGLASMIAFCITIYICWPTLWGNPIDNLVDVFNSLSKFRFVGNILFGGNLVGPGTIPWSYTITWLALTTPELWLLFAIIGFVIIFAGIINHPLSYLTDNNKRPLLLALICLLFPLIAIVVLNAVIYDGWRHMFFIYPSFVIIAVYGLDYLLKRRNKTLIWSLCSLQLVYIAYIFFNIHPYQQVYFNKLIAHKPGYISKYYEMDYWGASNKNALEWVLAHDKSENIKIFDLKLAELNSKILTKKQRARISFTQELTDADYYIQNYRTEPYWDAHTEVATARVIHEIEVQNSSIIRITKLK